MEATAIKSKSRSRGRKKGSQKQKNIELESVQTASEALPSGDEKDAESTPKKELLSTEKVKKEKHSVSSANDSSKTADQKDNSAPSVIKSDVKSDVTVSSQNEISDTSSSQNATAVTCEQVTLRDTGIGDIHEKSSKDCSAEAKQVTSLPVIEDLKQKSDNQPSAASELERNPEVQNNVLYPELLNRSENIKLTPIYPQLSEVSSIKEQSVSVEFEKPVDCSITVYPSLESISIQQDLLVFQALVKTFTKAIEGRAAEDAKKGYREFIQEQSAIEKHEFFDLVRKYERVRQEFIDVQKALKSNDHKLKRSKNALWKVVARKASAKGKCEDGNPVDICQTYDVREFNSDVLKDVSEIFHELEEKLLSDLAFYFYMDQLTKLQMELYVYNLLSGSATFADKSTATPLAAFVLAMPPKQYMEEISALKKCISVLFSFQRKPNYDSEFIDFTRNCLSNLIALLLRSGRLEDNLFVINHVFRCPSGISTWAAEYVQLPLPPLKLEPMLQTGTPESTYLDYNIAVLYMLMNYPVPERDTFLRYIKLSMAQSMNSSSDSNFVILGSDGEEEEERVPVCKEWAEEDIVALLNQIPITRIFQHILLFSSEDKYSVHRTTEEVMEKLLAFATFLVDIFHKGLKAYSNLSYDILTVRIGRLMRHTVHYVSDHWQNYKEANISVKCGLQAEFDRFFFHAVYKIFSIPETGAWKFLSGLPYENVSPRMLWNLLWIFHSSGFEEEEETVYSEKDVDIKLKNDEVRSHLREKLSEVDLSDALHLLNALEKMSSHDGDKEFVCCVAKEILETSVFNDELYDELAKEGRILISSIVDKHPCVLSLLIKEIDERGEKDASMLLFLFKDMSLFKWIPKPDDLQKISDWLLAGSLSSSKNRIARLILEKLNWENFSGPDHVVTPIELHRHVGILVTQAYAKYDSTGDTWSVSKGIEQMLNLYATIRCQSVESDQGFVAWAWEMLFSLKLHVLDHPNPPWVQIYDGRIESDSIPDIHRDTNLHPLLRAMEDKTPAGSYLAVVMTNIGHSSKTLAKEGLEIISTLVEQKQYAAVIHLLYYAFPFFAKCPEHITSNERFMLQLYDLIVADQSCFNIGSGPVVVGTVLQNIVTMIKHQAFQAWKVSVECASPLLKLWIHVLVKLLLLEQKMTFHQKLKGGTNQVYYLLDVVVQIAFGHNHTREGMVELMSSITKPVLSSPNGTHKASVWNLLFGGDKSSSLVPLQSLPDYPWFAWCVLVSECSQKQTQDLWLSVLNEMSLDGSITVEMALKKASAAVKIYSPPVLNLPVYRWCLQAIGTPVSHPILPLLWQQFFLYYLQRTTNTSGMKDCNSVGQRFFTSGAAVKIFQNVKAKLKEASDYFHACVEHTMGKLDNLYGSPSKQSRDTISLKGEEDKLKDDLSFYEELLHTFRAFSAWVDDPEIHKVTVCLPALEPKYYSDRLKLIIQNDQIPWIDNLIRIDQLKEKLENNDYVWPHCRKRPSPEVGVIKKEQVEKSTATERIMKRLKSYEDPKPLPPVKPLKPPVGEISDNMLASWDVLSRIVQSDQRIIWDQAKNFRDLLRKIRHLDSAYMNWANKEYEEHDFTVTHRKPCFKGTKDCAGPAVFHLKIQRCKRNEKVQEKLEQNRIDYHLVLNEIMTPPPPELCSAAMHMENCVRALVKKIEKSKGQQTQVLRNMGISLFYLQIQLTEKAIVSVADYTPSRQFFSSSIELLGREFIEDEEDQCLPLSKVLLQNPAAAGLASPFFNPNNAAPNIFLDVYDVLVKSVRSSAPSAVIVMLSKIDLLKWLTERKVSIADRKKLFTKIGRALINCGQEPQDEVLAIYELFKKHFQTLLLHQFPDHYEDAIHLLLSELEQKAMNVDVWYETFRCLGCCISTLESNVHEIRMALQKFALNQHLSPDQKLFVFTQPLHLKQVMDTVHYFNRYFLKIQQSSPRGLYKKFKQYVQPIAIFLGMMGHCMMDFYSSRSFNLSDKPIDLDGLWKAVHIAFYLWLDPHIQDSRLVFPWDQEEEEEARFVFQMFASCLGFHHKQLLGRKCQQNILSYVWDYYVGVYVSPGLRNYSTVVCHSTFLQLPWDEFHPSAKDIQGMCTVLRSDIPESREFLARLSIKIPWFHIMGYVTEAGDPSVIAKTYSVLGELLIISAWEFSVIKTNSHKSILKELETLSWHVLSPDMVGTLLDLYSSLADPLKLLKNVDDIADVYVLKFLKIVCVMVPGLLSQPHSTQKRLLYLSMYVKLLGGCVQENVDAILNCSDQFSLVLPTLLSDIESIVLKDAVPSEQVSCAMPPVREALGLLNYVTDIQLKQLARNSVTTWLSASPRSPLLLPCLKTACCSLTSVDHMVAIVECCIASRFDTELEDPAEATQIWHLLSSCFQVPPGMHDEFLNVCLERNAYLTQFNYVLHRLPQSSTEASKIMLLQSMVDWVKRTKPVENCETKMLLLWDKICELALKLASLNEQVVQNYLIAFCGVLNSLGEDRSRSGLWAAVGLGKQSPLSVNFRFLCRAMAAFLLLQMPEKGSLRLELMAPGSLPPTNSTASPSFKHISYDSSKPHPSSCAIKALENLRNLTYNKSYAALKSQVDCAVSHCLNPRYCLVESRHFLKELALQVFPSHAYLHVLDSQV